MNDGVDRSEEAMEGTSAEWKKSRGNPYIKGRAWLVPGGWGQMTAGHRQPRVLRVPISGLALAGFIPWTVVTLQPPR